MSGKHFGVAAIGAALLGGAYFLGLKKGIDGMGKAFFEKLTGAASKMTPLHRIILAQVLAEATGTDLPEGMPEVEVMDGPPDPGGGCGDPDCEACKIRRGLMEGEVSPFSAARRLIELRAERERAAQSGGKRPSAPNVVDMPDGFGVIVPGGGGKGDN